MRPELVDREDELAQLERGLVSAAAGEGRVVLVEAGLGLGKTSLLDALARRAEGEFAVLTAQGLELEADLAFGVARDLLRGEAERAVAGPAAALFAHGTKPQSSEPGLSAVVPSLFTLVAELTERGPALLIVDDAHVADAASLRFIAYLAVRAARLPILLVLAARPAEEGPWTRVRDTVLEQDHASLLSMPALGRRAVGELLAQRLEHAVEPGLVASTHEATGGNPLLVVELSRAFSQHGLEPTAEAVGDLAPQAVARAVLGRLSRMPEDATALARVASLFAEGVELRHAAALAGLDADRATTAADLLVRLEVLRPGRPLRFVHPAIRGALESDLPAGWKAAGHRRAAEMLAAEGADAERVAGHLLHAEPAADPYTVELLRTAAARAMAQGAAEAGIRYLSRALDEPVAAPERAQVLWDMGRMQLRLGDPQAAAPLAEAAELWQGMAPTELITDLARAHAFSWNSPAAIALLEERLAQDDVSREDQVGLGAELLWHLFTGQRRAETSRWLAQLPRDVRGTSKAECVLLAFQAAAACDRCDPYEHAQELARRSFGEHMFRDDPASPALPLGLGALRACGRFTETTALTRRIEALAVEQGADAVVEYLTALRSEQLLLSGSLADAEADARFSLELSERIGDRFVMYHLSVWALANVLVAQGAVDDALALCETAGDPPPHFTGDLLRHARATARIAAGDDASAEQDLVYLKGRCEESEIGNPCYWPRPDFALAPLWRRSGREAEARAMADAALDQARAFGAPWGIGAALRCRALSGDGSDAVGLLRESVTELRRSEARLLLTEALIDLGAALRRGGERAAGREPLREALAMAHAAGARLLADRAADELRLAGGRVHRPAASGPEALTAAERRVARLVAEGLTNQEVARHLFLSVKTVESHLRVVFRKLDIAARGQIAAALDQ